MQRKNRENNNTVRSNPAGENNRAPMPMGKSEVTMNRSGKSGSPKSIPSTMGYVGARIK